MERTSHSGVNPLITARVSWPCARSIFPTRESRAPIPARASSNCAIRIDWEGPRLGGQLRRYFSFAIRLSPQRNEFASDVLTQ